jgi:hypothetical protein
MLGQQVNSNLVEWPLHRTLKANTVLRSGGGSIRLATSQNISSKCRAGTTEHSCDCLGRGGVAKTSQKLKLRRKNVPVLRFWRPLRCDGLNSVEIAQQQRPFPHLSAQEPARQPGLVSFAREKTGIIDSRPVFAREDAS